MEHFRPAQSVAFFQALCVGAIDIFRLGNKVDNMKPRNRLQYTCIREPTATKSFILPFFLQID